MMTVHRDAAVKTSRKPRRKTEPVTVTKPNPVTWAKALELANGNPRRLKIIDANTVLVNNHD